MLERLDLDIRKKIHANFWNSADRIKQWNFINKFSQFIDDKVPLLQVKQKLCTTENPSRPKFNVHHFLPISGELHNSELIRVCRKTFLNTLSTTDQVAQLTIN